MRELAVQAVNGTNNATDRARLQTEVGQLQSELTRASTQARFNNELILDGNLSKSFQVGINGSETVSFSQTSVATSALGAHTIDVGPQAAGTHATSATAAVANLYTVDVPRTSLSLLTVNPQTLQLKQLTLRKTSLKRSMPYQEQRASRRPHRQMCKLTLAASGTTEDQRYLYWHGNSCRCVNFR